MKNKKISRTFPFILIHLFFKYLKVFMKKISRLPVYLDARKNFSVLVEQNKSRGFIINKFESNIYLEATGTTAIDRDYIYHTAWAARILKKTNPSKHIDISSCLRFVAIASAIVPIEFYDFRPAEIKLPNLKSLEGNLLSLPFEDNSCESISSLSVIEHIGLGRYGDAIDADGDLKAIAELKRVTQPGGNLLVEVPLHHESKIVYNAHRLYKSKDFIEYFIDEFDLLEFSIIGQDMKDGGLISSPSDEQLEEQTGMYYGCFLV